MGRTLTERPGLAGAASTTDPLACRASGSADLNSGFCPRETIPPVIPTVPGRHHASVGAPVTANSSGLPPDLRMSTFRLEEPESYIPNPGARLRNEALRSVNRPALSAGCAQILDRLLRSFCSQDLTALSEAQGERARKYVDLLKDPQRPFSVQLLESPNANACIIVQSRKIFVNVGLFQEMVRSHGTDAAWDRLAFILAHEISHSLYEGAGLLPKDRDRRLDHHDMENQCDRDALRLMDAAGYNVRYASFSIFGKEAVSIESADSSLLSSHPGLYRRELALQESIRNGYWRHYSENPGQGLTREEMAEASISTRTEQLLDLKTRRQDRSFNGALVHAYEQVVACHAALGAETFDRPRLESMKEELPAWLRQDFEKFKQRPHPEGGSTLDQIRVWFDDLVKEQHLKNTPQDFERFAQTQYLASLAQVQTMGTLYQAAAEHSQIDFLGINPDGARRELQRRLNEEKEIGAMRSTLKSVDRLLQQSELDPLQQKVLRHVVREVMGFESTCALTPGEVRTFLEQMPPLQVLDEENLPVLVPWLSIHRTVSTTLQGFLEKEWLRHPPQTVAAVAEFAAVAELLTANFEYDAFRTRQDPVDCDADALAQEVRRLVGDHNYDAIRLLLRHVSVESGQAFVRIAPDLIDHFCSTGRLDDSGLRTQAIAEMPLDQLLELSLRAEGPDLSRLVSALHHHLMARQSAGDLRPEEKDTVQRAARQLLAMTNKAHQGWEFMDRDSPFASATFERGTIASIVSICCSSQRLTLEEADLLVRCGSQPNYDTTGKQLETFLSTCADGELEQLVTAVGQARTSRDTFATAEQVLKEFAARRHVPVPIFPIYTCRTDYQGRTSIFVEDSYSFTDNGSTPAATGAIDLSAYQALPDRDILLLAGAAPPATRILFSEMLLSRFEQRGGPNLAELRALAGANSPDFLLYLKDEQPRPPISEATGRPWISHRDYVYARFFSSEQGQRVSQLPPLEVAAWMREHWPQPSAYRDAVLCRSLKGRFEEIPGLDQQLEVLALFHDPGRAAPFRQKCYEQHQSTANTLQQSLGLITAVFPNASAMRDILIDQTFEHYPFRISEFSHIERLLSTNSRSSDRERSIVEGTLGTAVSNLDGQEKAGMLLWLMNSGPVPAAVEALEAKLCASLGECRIGMADVSTRTEILRALCIGTRGLFASNNSAQLHDCLDRLFGEALKEREGESPEQAKLKCFGREVLHAVFDIDNNHKKMDIVQALFSIPPEQVNVEQIIGTTLARYGVVGRKLSQILASQPGMREDYPELHAIFEQQKSRGKRMSILQTMQAVVRNPALVKTDCTIQPSKASASVKRVLDSSEGMIKVRYADASKFLEQEERDFAVLSRRLSVPLRQVFQIEHVPDYSRRIFKSIREEIDFPNEIRNGNRLAEILAKDSTASVTLAVPKVRTELCDENTIVEAKAEGESLGDYRRHTTRYACQRVEAQIQRSLHRQYFRHHFFHVDPQSENIFVAASDSGKLRITFIDTGSCAAVQNEQERRFIRGIVRAAVLPWSSSRHYGALLNELVPADILRANESLIGRKLAELDAMPVPSRPVALLNLMDQLPGYAVPDGVTGLLLSSSRDPVAWQRYVQNIPEYVRNLSR